MDRSTVGRPTVDLRVDRSTLRYICCWANPTGLPQLVSCALLLVSWVLSHSGSCLRTAAQRTPEALAQACKRLQCCLERSCQIAKDAWSLSKHVCRAAAEMSVWVVRVVACVLPRKLGKVCCACLQAVVETLLHVVAALFRFCWRMLFAACSACVDIAVCGTQCSACVENTACGAACCTCLADACCGLVPRIFLAQQDVLPSGSPAHGEQSNRKEAHALL